jgi:hypothetical protein
VVFEGEKVIDKIEKPTDIAADSDRGVGSIVEINKRLRIFSS